MIDLDQVPADVCKLAAGCLLKAIRLDELFDDAADAELFDETPAQRTARLAKVFQLSIEDYTAAVGWIADYYAREAEALHRDIEERADPLQT
jgi:hypothetical protein